MHTVTVPAPTVNRIPKTKGGFKKKANGKRADPVPRPIFLNANQRPSHHQKANWTALWREAGRNAAIEASLPSRDGFFFVVATIHLPREVLYDAANYYPTIKACLDGIIGDHGFLPDDSNEHILGPLHVKGAKAKNGMGGVVIDFYDMEVSVDREVLMERLGAFRSMGY